ncbi:stem cell self-renewal protein Piwi [Rhizodiscina lignyota]|uniref:Stem cell self-renewal protein Piwi n=1 Tax=Rhizodiscina lignyota TaxID=1504668 RepID=A0A9P4IJC5_9PEZI|nr:stem cell self-renewal protein Piwi [Rhizodiscina lignyota]
MAEKSFGIRTLCFSRKTLGRCWSNTLRDSAGKIRPLMPYMANIAMKVNLKFGGVNHEVEGLSGILGSTLLLGADVTHPGSGALDGVPSVAAVVGNIDASCGRFLGSMRLQSDKNVELIEDFQSMVEQRLVAYAEHNSDILLAKVIFYRDGVGDSQYEALRNREVAKIRQAYKILQLKYPKSESSVKVTAIVVAKRHDVRFFPKSQDSIPGNGNCKPGLLVDTGVTSPYYMDLYLQSHNGIKGTAKPAHYIVLEDEIGFSADDNHNLVSLSVVRMMLR